MLRLSFTRARRNKSWALTGLAFWPCGRYRRWIRPLLRCLKDLWHNLGCKYIERVSCRSSKIYTGKSHGKGWILCVRYSFQPTKPSRCHRLPGEGDERDKLLSLGFSFPHNRGLCPKFRLLRSANSRHCESRSDEAISQDLLG